MPTDSPNLTTINRLNNTMNKANLETVARFALIHGLNADVRIAGLDVLDTLHKEELDSLKAELNAEFDKNHSVITVDFQGNTATLPRVTYNNICDYLQRGMKIQAIKEVRTVTGWGLREAKDLVEQYHDFRKHYKQLP